MKINKTTFFKLFAFAGVMAISTHATAADDGLVGMISGITDIFAAINQAIPLIAFVFGAIAFVGGIWAFKQSGEQQSPNGWKIGATAAILVGLGLMYFQSTVIIGEKSLIQDTGVTIQRGDN